MTLHPNLTPAQRRTLETGREIFHTVGVSAHPFEKVTWLREKRVLDNLAKKGILKRQALKAFQDPSDGFWYTEATYTLS